MVTDDLLSNEGLSDIESFRSRLEELDALPSIPAILVELLELLKDPDSQTNQITELLSQDAGLVARLLKIVNSAAVALRTQVTSIDRAVSLLGRDQLRQICLGGGVWDSLAGIAQKAKFDLEAFERHGLITGRMATELGKRSKFPDAEDLFASGLLHDIGKFLLLAYDGETYINTLKRAQESQTELIDMEFENIGWTHSVVGGWLAEHWALPLSVREAIRWHHDPESIQNKKLMPAVTLITIANNLSKAAKMGYSGNPVIKPIGGFLSQMGLTPNDLKEVAAQIRNDPA